MATRSRCDVATPTTTSPWPKRPVRTCGAETTSSGPSVVARDIDNFRAALDWAVETPSPEHALRLVAPLAVQGRIGELAMDWAATAVAIPGGDGHPLFPVVAAWAAWGATMGREFERAEDLVAVAERAQAALGARLPSVARAQATVAFFGNDFEGARRHAAEWVELARESGDAYELAHGLTMLAARSSSPKPTLDAAIATADEAVRVARAAGIDTALIFALLDPRGLLPLEESRPRARPARRSHRRSAPGSATAWAPRTRRANVAGIAARRGDWRTALQAAVDSAEQKLELGDSR